MIILYVIDRTFRHSRGTTSCVVDEIQVVSNKFTLIRVKKGDRTSFSFKTGQFVFLNLPLVLPLQWHPFTIANSEKHTIESGRMT
eukprot:UN10230